MFSSLLFLCIYPSKLTNSDGVLYQYNTTIYLKILIIALIIGTIYDVIRRYNRYKSISLYKLISPFTIIGILIIMNFGMTNYSTISPDDYHSGEYLLGWWSYLDGYLPYVDYFPSHGIFENDLAGFCNLIFFDGTAGSLREATRLNSIIINIFIYLCLYYYTRNTTLSFFILFFYYGRMSYLLLIAFFLIWTSKRLLKNKLKWSIVWLTTVPILIIGLPPQGLLFTLSSSIICLYVVYQLIKEKDYLSIKYIISYIVLLIMLFVLTPLGLMFYHAVEYVVTNGSINHIAYGIPWERSYLNDRTNATHELTKMLWGLAPLSGLLIIYKSLISKELKIKQQYLLSLVFIIIFSILIMPYTMGRIDHLVMSRPGIIGQLLLTLLFPIILHGIMKNKTIYVYILLTFFVGIYGYRGLTSDRIFRSFIYSLNNVTAQDFKNTNLKNIGKAIIKTTHLERLQSIDKTLSKYLKPEESYLDLTSRIGQYYYLNRKPIITIPAVYNLPGKKSQLEAIEKIKTKEIKIALFKADNFHHDGGGLGSRNNYLFKYVLDNYYPIKIGDLIYGFRKNLFVNGKWKDLNIPNQTNYFDNAEKSFSKKHLDNATISWGKSFQDLRNNQHIILKHKLDDLSLTRIKDLNKINNQYNITGKDPYIVWDVKNLNIKAKNAGILKFESEFEFQKNKNRKEPIIQIYWWGNEKIGGYEQSSITLNADNGLLLVPLDANPRWQLLTDINGIRIDIDNPDCCSSFKIKNIELYERETKIHNTKLKTTFSTANFSDQNWKNGIILNSKNSFIISNNIEYNILEGGTLEFPTGKRKVIKLTYDNRFIRYYVDGEMLDPEKDGYPNNIKIKKNK